MRFCNITSIKQSFCLGQSQIIMTFILLLSILLISDFCHSFKPNFYNGRYLTRDLKTNETSSSTPKSLRVLKNYHNSNKISGKLQKFNSKLSSTTLKPTTFPENKRYNDTDLETQFWAHTKPYTAGVISNILNRFSSTPILANKFGSYQSQIEFESPITTTMATFHATRQPKSESGSMRGRNPAGVALVRTASLNSEVFHPPQYAIEEKEQPLLISLPKFQYDHTIVHNNEPKHMELPFIRKQRNLNENSKDFNEKLTQYKESGGNNETQYLEENDNHNDDDDDDDADLFADENETKVLAETSRDQPLERLERRYSHDILLNYPKPHHVNYGHVQLSPELFEKRFESKKEGNRYKGEILWKDNKGGYAQHNWDMALGKL